MEERSISWLPRVCSHELLEPSVTRREKSMDVSFVSISCLVRELQNIKWVSSEHAHSVVHCTFNLTPLLCITTFAKLASLSCGGREGRERNHFTHHCSFLLVVGSCLAIVTQGGGGGGGNCLIACQIVCFVCAVSVLTEFSLQRSRCFAELVNS